MARSRLLRLPHLLEVQRLAALILEYVSAELRERGSMLKNGTLTDPAVIAAYTLGREPGSEKHW
jgi:hypothetical protein